MLYISKFINNYFLFTFILKEINRTKGTNEEVKVTIIFLNVKGPVNILFLYRKKLFPFHSSIELMTYKNKNY
jgi:hypothetical protein